MSELSSHGSWPSPISAADVARGVRAIAFPSIVGDEVWWEEARPEEGRRTIMRRAANGTVTDLLAAPWSVGSRVHEYGGRSFRPVPRRDDKALVRMGVVFVNSPDQRLYLLEHGSSEPVPLTPEPAAPAALRHADPVLGPDGRSVLCVREHHAGGTVRRSIVSVPLSGRGANDAAAVREVASGADFYASPAPSPDGSRLAYVRWNHPKMPWDGTELRMGLLTDGGLTGEYTLRGSSEESVVSPVWNSPSTLYVASDWPGWWNLYQVGLTGPAIALYPAEEEFHAPPGRLGDRSFCVLDSGKVVALHGDADMVPGVYDPDTLDLAPVDTDLTSWSMLDTDGRGLVAVASSPTVPQSLVRLDPVTGRVEILHRSVETMPDPAYLPIPRKVTLPGRYGASVHANVYPPTHPERSPEGPAPYVVWAHGGPVSHSTVAFDPVKAYFTSRGIGIVDVNYGGSTGYGRSYRKRLDKEWGVVDVEDVTAVARALVEEGRADAGRLAVRGPSAGGYTALSAVTGDVFACGVSYFGVADLLGLARTTHDFESRFLDSLVGLLPGFVERYRERSPINRTSEIEVPVLLLQGLDDPVVTPDQAFAMATALGERKVPYALVEFEGEAHGFTGERARRESLEAELGLYARVFGFEADVPPLELATEPPAPRPEPEPEAVDEAEPLQTPPGGVSAASVVGPEEIEDTESAQGSAAEPAPAHEN
ncbi:S9 family peptidase [Nocardiopsis lambiniae]|uniref:Prolyl oligopeptidase family serine peptidase n=1 Tax=Nocardiopsis lambiniae TaxID=3075539 RepID=A0ABU2M490_9ACTN|nr:prolyl oligopeptidase family serine peptidase [Nocardiopsis sp. DSM 44743]MDT0327454.1 prolyl oligopeptidase family serine peptidase [Nocardiopsis sp. DSM 44743]